MAAGRSRVEEVLPGVHRFWFPSINNNAYLLMGDQLTLVDAGPPRRAERILDHLAALGRRPSDVTSILVTHCHTDHTGNLAALARETGATVFAHAADAGIVREGAPRPRGLPHTLTGRILVSLFRQPSLADAARVDREIDEGDEVPGDSGMRVLHTPGHTAGHLSFLWPVQGGVLFVGDAAGNIRNKLGVSLLNDDTERSRASLRRLAELDFAAACFGHGRVITRAAAGRFRAVAGL
jgi:glyoxylase-like metal-dependent hydrolase (beta-lactamase superfamily II)